MSIIVLNATTKSIEALLSGAVATNQPEFSAHYADVTSTAFTEGENDGVLNNTTAVSLVAAPAAATRRIVKEIVIYNADTAAVTVTIRINNNSNYRRIQKVTLAAGATWKLSDGGVSTSAGSGDVVGPASATDGHLAVFDGVTGKLLKDGGAVPTGGGGGASTPPGRLSLQSGVPIPTTDQVDKTMLFYVLMTGSLIQLWGGSAWVPVEIASEPSLNMAAFTTSSMYDIFMYSDSGVPTMEGSLTTRTTELPYFEGRQIKTGDATRLYIGSVYIDAAGKCQDTTSLGYVFNQYNDTQKCFKATDPTNSWTYTLATHRAANGNTTNGVGRVSVLVGSKKSSILAVHNYAARNASVGTFFAGGIGINSTSVDSCVVKGYGICQVANIPNMVQSLYAGYLPIGLNYIQSLEYSAAYGTTTWSGDEGTTEIQTGLVVYVDM